MRRLSAGEDGRPARAPDRRGAVPRVRALPRLLVLLAVLAAGLLPLLPDPSTAAPRLLPAAEQVLLEQDGAARGYAYTVPTTGAEPRPLVLALHGRAQSVEALERVSGLAELGQERGFVTAYPSGHESVWSAGTCCLAPDGTSAPDVAFLDRVLDDVAARTPVDPERVYVVGFSNGAMMAYRYACQGAHRLAGVGVVSGSMAADPSFAGAGPQRCRPARSTSLVVVHGGRDLTVPYAGGHVGADPSALVAPVRAGVDQFAVAAGCRSSRTSRVGASQRLDYTGCDDGAGVRLVKLPLHGHGWTRDSRRYGYDTTVGLWSFLATRRAGPAEDPPAA